MASCMTVELPICTLVYRGDTTVIVFDDGKVNIMDRRWLDKPEYHAIARQFGYEDDWRRYNREHDLLHALIALWLGLPYSHALHDGDPAVPLDDASQQIKDEEHFVNAMQGYMMTGQEDDYGLLRQTFGDQLDPYARAARYWSAYVR